MARSTYRVLKSRGRVTLIETANPGMGIGYAVRKAGVAIWSGDNLAEAEIQFKQAAA